MSTEGEDTVSRLRGFTRQPCLVLARDPAVFETRLAEAGGRRAVRTGVLIDIPFAALLCGAFGALLVCADGPWWMVVLPALALALDLVEGRTLWVIAGEATRTRRAVQLLFWIAVVKFVAYGASLIVSAWAVYMLVST